MIPLENNFNNPDKSKLSIWGLIHNGYFEEACRKADLEYSVNKDLLALNNKVFALLLLRDYENAEKLTDQIIELRSGRGDGDFILNGIAKWFLNQEEEAIKTWLGAQNTPYTDASGGIELQCILYFSSICTLDEKLRRSIIKSIKRLLRNKRAANWPGSRAGTL